MIIVDERLARKFWPGQDPIGKYMYRPASVKNIMEPPPRDQWLTVVGVVEDVRLDGPGRLAGVRRVGAYYFAAGAVRRRAACRSRVRTAQDPTALTSAIRREIAAIDPELPFYGVRTMDERVELLAGRSAHADDPRARVRGGGVLPRRRSASTACWRIRCRSGRGRSAFAWRSAPKRRASSAWCCARARYRAVGALGLGGAFALAGHAVAALRDRRDGSARRASVAGVLLAVALACLLPARRAARTDPVIALTE